MLIGRETDYGLIVVAPDSLASRRILRAYDRRLRLVARLIQAVLRDRRSRAPRSLVT